MRFLTSLVIGSNNKNKIDNKEDKSSTQYIYQTQKNNNNKESVYFNFTIGGGNNGDNNKKKKSIYRRWSSPFHFSKRSSSSSSSVKSSTSTHSSKDLFDDFESQYKFAKEELICAVKSQGSNYFLDDYYDAKEAIDKCIHDYQKLINHVSQDDVCWLNSQWIESLMYLTSTIRNLTPPPSV